MKTLKSKDKNKMLRTTRSEVRKKNNKFFNQTVQREKNSLRRRNNKYSVDSLMK